MMMLSEGGVTELWRVVEERPLVTSVDAKAELIGGYGRASTSVPKSPFLCRMYRILLPLNSFCTQRS